MWGVVATTKHATLRVIKEPLQVLFWKYIRENIPPNNDVKLCICVAMTKAIRKGITKVHMLARKGPDENKLVR